MQQFGPRHVSDGLYRFTVWAPEIASVSLVLHRPDRKVLPMEKQCGFHIAEALVTPGAQYLFQLPDGRELPDPASRLQPDGVHGVSAVVELANYPWTDQSFEGHTLSEMIIYELHVGTFTEEGTLAAAISRLDLLTELGITAVELMPLAQFPGSRNWGYDGVYPFAVQKSYGGPVELQQFVDAAHGRSLSVILDVVYNHLGPEGNYLGAFAPFFTDRYRTPWGQAINYDGAESGPVRAFFIQNALHWIEDFHIDALRLDAIHGIYDFGARHFLAELNDNVRNLAATTGRKLHLIAESDLNDARVLHCSERGGYGLAAQWSDDFHHALHTLLTQESSGYYADFGTLQDLAVVLEQGWRYSGQYSRFRRRAHGNSPADLAPDRFVACIQNHDQIGNRAGGERLSQLVDLERLKLAAGVTLLSPFVPLLFMGEEYGEKRPFLYFTSHLDAALVEAVRKGRRDEFASFGWIGDVHDPQDETAFARSKLDFAIRNSQPHRTLWRLYQSLIALRKGLSLGSQKPEVRANREQQTITLIYVERSAPHLVAFNFGGATASLHLPANFVADRPLINSADPLWLGPAGTETQPPSHKVLLAPYSFAVFTSGANK